MSARELFLICPDCFLETKIVDEFGPGSYFLTSLGSVMEFSEVEFAEDVNRLLTDKKIKYIYLVNDTNCTFLSNVICPNQIHKHDEKTESVLKSLVESNAQLFKSLPKAQKLEQLASLNVDNQALNFLHAPYINFKIKNGDIKLRGLLYNRNKNKFKEVEIGAIEPFSS